MRIPNKRLNADGRESTTRPCGTCRRRAALLAGYAQRYVVVGIQVWR